MPDERFALGAWREPQPGGNAITRFRLWAPTYSRIDLVIERDDTHRVRALTRDDRGYWSGAFDDVTTGDLYRYRLDADDARVFPDPVSRFQPRGVHGPSQVVDPSTFQWTDHSWRAPGRDDLVFYELHAGTFSPQGTFRGIVERLPYLSQLGVNAIELMPVADFPGDRNWGYDGVAIFAPARCYGTPDDLRALVNAAHQHGIAVFLDVVYNHLGPDGAYANVFSPYYFTGRHRSPWGQGVNIDGEHSADVRAFFIANALHWIDEYHFDGLRLDATHAIQDDGPRHFLEELTSTVRASAARAAVIVAEDHRNLASLLTSRETGGCGLDAVWADDFHHQIRVHVAHDCEGYYEDFSGSTEDIAATIRNGWFFSGQHSLHFGARRGTDPAALDLRRFIVCIQNHDQIGNRADGARLNQEIDAAVFRAVSALLFVVPETPLIFQGQEWATSAPFLFFTDHHDELGRSVTEGRRREFASFASFVDATRRAQIPDPQAPSTFEQSRLRWRELEAARHASMLHLYQRLIGLRMSAAPLRSSSRDSIDARPVDGEGLLITRCSGRERLWIAIRLGGAGVVSIEGAGGAVHHARTLLTTEDADVVVDSQPIEIDARGDDLVVRFTRPGAAIVQSPNLPGTAG